MLWFLLACVRTFQVGEVPVDTAPDSPVDDTAVDDTGELPSVCVPGTSSAWRLPSPRWGLGALHTERRLEEAGLPLDANFLLALGWQATRYGCSDFGAPWTYDEATVEWGCMALPSDTAQHEFCRLWPSDLGCPDIDLSGDTPERSMVGLGRYATLVPIYQQGVTEDPGALLQQATDPDALEKLIAHALAMGLWTDEAVTALTDCPDAIDACLEPWLQSYLNGAVEKRDTLAQVDCYEEPLSEQDVRTYTQELQAALPGLEFDEEAAVDALTGQGFHVDAPRVLDALDASGWTHYCPEHELNAWYGFSCL